MPSRRKERVIPDLEEAIEAGFEDDVQFVCDFEEGDNVAYKEIYIEGEGRPDFLYGTAVILMFILIVMLILIAFTTKTRRYKR